MSKWHMLSPEQRADEAEKILDPACWPLFPVLPVKRTGPGMPLECGTLLAGERPFRVYKANVHLLKDGPVQPQLEKAGTIGTYATLEEMQANGWRGD